jgi:hypothetical protein
MKNFIVLDMGAASQRSPRYDIGEKKIYVPNVSLLRLKITKLIEGTGYGTNCLF